MLTKRFFVVLLGSISIQSCAIKEPTAITVQHENQISKTVEINQKNTLKRTVAIARFSNETKRNGLLVYHRQAWASSMIF